MSVTARRRNEPAGETCGVEKAKSYPRYYLVGNGCDGGDISIERKYRDGDVNRYSGSARKRRSGFSYDAFRNRLFVGRAASNIVSILFLDTNRTLTVASLNPASGVSITVSPNDINGQGNGVTQFTRTYNDGANVMLTAPATAGGTDFQKWQRDGVDYSSSQNTTVMMDANHTMTAVYVCGVTLSQTSQSFSASGGNDSFNVTNQTGCNWTASTTSPWINITSGSMGSGNGTVANSVTANTATSSHSGNITVGSQTYTVLQGAAFLDVPISHPFYTEIGKLSSRGVTLGCGGGNYCPTLAVTRGQMAAFLVRAFNL